MKTRLLRLIQVPALLGFAAIVLGISIGFQSALGNMKAQIERSKPVEPESWERFAGNVVSLQPAVTLTVITLYGLAVLVAPEVRNDKRSLQKLAKQKLSEPYLTAEEEQFWLKIAREVEHDEPV